MTETPQPPGTGDSLPEPPPAQPGPQPGGGYEQPSFGAWPGGPVSPGAPGPRRRTGLIVAIAAALVVVVAGAIGLGVGLRGSGGSTSSRGSSGGSITLPGVLLGLPRYAGSRGQVINTGLARQEAAGSKGVVVHVVAAAYGDQSGSRPGFAVAGGRFCGTCGPNPASKVVQFMVSHGFADARSFPPGPGGVTLACGSQTGGTVIDCKWSSSELGGDILFFHGFASGLADAAAKSRQILAAVEH